MAIRDKIDELKGIFRDESKNTKKFAIAGLVTLVVSASITLNINLIRMNLYTFRGQITEVIGILEKEILNQDNQSDLYFELGMDYVLETLDEQGKRFINENFIYLNEEIQNQVIAVYNQQNLFLESNQEVLKKVSRGNPTNEEKKYIQRIEHGIFEKELNILFGDNPKVTQDMVTLLYNIASLRSEKLSMETFQFSIYELMSFPHEGDMENIAIKLIGHIEEEAVREVLFGEMKTKSIEIEQLDMWIDILNKKRIVTTEEYVAFTNSYSEIKRIREENTALLIQEVDLQNVKDAIELQTVEYTQGIEKAETEIVVLEEEIIVLEQQVRELTMYKEVDVYILDQYTNGEYEAANPEKSWLFGSYKPGDERMIVKIADTPIDYVGVYTLDLYHLGENEDGIMVYEEVSIEDKNHLLTLEQQVKEKKSMIDEKKVVIERFLQEVDNIYKANNYEQTVELLEGVQDRKDALVLELQIYKVELQNLFEIGDIVVGF